MEQDYGSLWQDYLHVALDPAHILAELTFTVVFDFIIIALMLPLIKIMFNKVRNSLHKELDEEHGIPPHD